MKAKKIGPTLKEICSELKKDITKSVAGIKMPDFEPTGALEPAIAAVGNEHGVTWIVNIQTNNKSGKTAIGAVITRNIVWENCKKYFDFPNFNNWPFYTSDYDENGNVTNKGSIIARGRIVGLPQNLKPTGPIRTEILKWWPPDRYTSYKDKNSGYYDRYECNGVETNWFFDVLSFHQDPEAFEGPLISFHWVDEPPKPELLTAFTARHTKGGIILLTQTPYRAGPMLDALDDLKDQGYPVLLPVESTIWKNSITSGTLNSTGTKRGLMTDAEIKSWVKGISPDQRDARCFGRGTKKQGKVYKGYSDTIHVRDFEIDDPRFKLANCYCVMDPHDKYYPFIQWWAVFPPNRLGKCYHVCYNEWPTVDYFDGMFYDKIRKDPTHQCALTWEEISEWIKLYDMTQFGYNVIDRAIDPRYEFCLNVQKGYLKYGLTFKIPERDLVETQRDKIVSLQKYEHSQSINEYNEPCWFLMPHVENTRRSFDRHYWVDQTMVSKIQGKYKEKESEPYKDPCDCARLFESLVEGKGYKPIQLKEKKKKKKLTFINCRKQVAEGMVNINLR